MNLGNSNQYSTDNTSAMIRIFSKQRDGLKVCHLNAQSIVKKIDELRNLFENSGVDVVCISETWLSKHILDGIYSVRGYRLLRVDREGHGGGVAIYVRNGINIKIIAQSPCDSLIEYLFIEIMSNESNLLLGCVYRPNRNVDTTNFIDFLDSFTLNYSNILICGDFNCNLLVENTLVDAMLPLGLFPVNNSTPTHFTKSTNTLLDLFLTSATDCILFYDQLSVPVFSKHDLIFCIFDFNVKQTVNSYSYRDFKNINTNNLHNKIIAMDWNAIYSNVDIEVQISIFEENIISLYNEFVPIKTKVVKDGQREWFSKHIENLIASRNKAYNEWKRFKTDHLYSIFKNARKIANIAIKTAKTHYFMNKFNSAISSKDKWKEIKNIGISKKPQYSPNMPNIDELNKRFVDIDVPPVQNNTYDTIPYTTNNLFSNFCFSCIAQDEVLSSILSVKSNAVGIDGICPKFIKLILPYVLPYITFIFNTILTKSIFPAAWKKSKVIPIHKIGNDFRPISILPFLSKCLEKILHKQISEFMISKNFFHDKQSGFRQGRSCTTALIDVTENIRQSLDIGQTSFLILLDHSKAFDCVDINILMTKLDKYANFSSTAIKLLSTYLSNRSQAVFLESKNSNFLPVTRGVPQGSILGPLLFSVYINDLPSSLTTSNVHMYADDVQIFSSCNTNNLLECISNLNRDLDAVNKWALNNGLCLNPKKSKCIVIAKRNVETQNLPSLLLNKSPIEFVNTAKNLGVTFNKTLSWNNHINIAIGNVCARLRSLWITQHYTPLSIRMLLAKTYLIPTLIYGCEVFVNPDAESKRKLKVIYNKITRYVFGLHRFSRNVTILSNRILGTSLENIIHHRSLILLHKVIVNNQPTHLNNLLKFCRSNRYKKLVVPKYKTSFSEHHFLVFTIRLWNNLPSHLQFINHLERFKTELFWHLCNS